MQSCAVLRNRYFGLRWTMKKAIPTKRHFQLRSLTTITKTSTAASILSGLISMPIFFASNGPRKFPEWGIDGEPFQRGGAFLRYEPQGADGRNFRNGISAFVGLPVPSAVLENAPFELTRETIKHYGFSREDVKLLARLYCKQQPTDHRRVARGIRAAESHRLPAGSASKKAGAEA